jgi:succinate-semialdehyde dehydrogenase / glutarate-semialdehyde dehydrogenase
VDLLRCWVFNDCDLGNAVQQTLIAKFRNTGQSCIAANRVYVQREIRDKFLEEFVARVKKLKTGSNPLGRTNLSVKSNTYN